MSRPRSLARTKPHPKMQFRPQCERLEARAMMVGSLDVALNNLFPIGESANAWDEGEGLNISLVQVYELIPAEEGEIWVLRPDGISDVAWKYTFTDLISETSFDIVVPLGADPNVLVPWSAFVTGGINDQTLVSVTVTALDSDLVPLLGPDELPITDETLVVLENESPTIANISHTAEGGGSCAGGPTTVTLTATLGDPSPSDTVTATINWGDTGSDPDDEFAFDGSKAHVYAPGTYTITITASDEEGGVTVTTYEVEVTGGGGTGSVSLASGVLTITGSCGDDLVYVSTDGGTLSVQANFLPAPDYVATFAAGAVTEIRALLGDGNDAFTVGGNIDVPIVVAGGNGNDMLMGGRGASLLIGGDGADMLFGGRGADALIGGSTVHDTNAAALGALLAEWQANLNTPLLFAADLEIVDDDDSDVLHGGQDVDLLFLDGALDDALASRRDVIFPL